MNEIRSKARWRAEQDDWQPNGRKIASAQNLNAIRDVLENRGSIIVEHWLYRGASAPERKVFDDFEDFLDYLKAHTYGGDAIDVWSMHDLCTRQNRLATGKVPDLDGCVPSHGAY
ncbi:MAG: hypothetical protein ND895_24180 [Pyrinomonadaceae bacterium]|nr:hypothetical protein [Pyrinomonadaceae bacterium]